MPQPPRGRSRTSGPRSNGGGGKRRPSSSGAPRVNKHRSELDDALTAALDREYAPIASFAELGLPAKLVETLSSQGLDAPFAIQTRAMPDALAGRDVLGRAQTGSGKTLGFGLPLLTRLSSSGEGIGVTRPGAPRGLVLVPTRELAVQVAEVLTPLARSVGLSVTTVYGGTSYGRQLDALHRGVDIVIATPGRLVDLIERRACRLDGVVVTVLDEADYMADLGFLPVVTRLLEMTPSDGQRLLFSATLDGGIETLVTKFLTEPSIHAVAATTASVDAMDHMIFRVDAGHKVAIATEVAERPGRTLFFVRTKHGADRLAKQITKGGTVEAAAIHGNLGQGARQRALNAFAEGRVRVLVATDVAARGIHVDDVDLVVHYDPPNDHKDYLHRSGRTARAGATGTVLALALPEQVRDMQRLHTDAKVTATMDSVAPGHHAVRTVATSGEPVVIRTIARTEGSSSREGGGPRRSGRGGGAGRGGAPRGGSGSGRPQGSRGGPRVGPSGGGESHGRPRTPHRSESRA